MLILYNANIYHKEPGNPTTALAIQNDRILALGNDIESLNTYGEKASRQDMKGKTIWPGLIDAHLHLTLYALNLQHIDCETHTISDCLQRVKDQALHSHSGEWILGHGWNQNEWPGGFGTASQLDEVSPNNPVYLTSKSLHSAWANSKALALAGITRDTPDPERGVIQREGLKEPTGILFEAAMELCDKAIPEPTILQIKDAIQQAQARLLGFGITGVHDFDTSSCFAALQMLHEEKALNLRVVKGIPKEDLPHAISLGLRTGFGDDLLRIGPVKLFADGALGPLTAAMLHPYEGESDYSGILMMDAEQIIQIGVEAVDHGISLAIHAIGDRANHEVLNAYAQLRTYERSKGLPPLRHRIEHVQIIDPEDQARFAELQIVASMQPIHAPSDMVMADRHWGLRSKDAYAWRSILNYQTRLAFGSDAPVESPNPFWGLHAAVTRCRPDGSPGPNGWYPEQRLQLIEALQAFTTGAAYAAGMEDRVGKIAPGFYADLIVLEQDPFKIAPEVLHLINPLATMFAGKWVSEKG